jgi:hypothetical protein
MMAGRTAEPWPAGRAIAPATSALTAGDVIGPTQLLGIPAGRNRVIGGLGRVSAIAAGVDNFFFVTFRNLKSLALADAHLIRVAVICHVLSFS